MRVFPQVQRAIGALTATVVADGLGDGQDVGFVKRAVQRRAAVPAGTEADPLGRVLHIGLARIILAFELGQVHQDVLWSWFPGEGGDHHGVPPFLHSCPLNETSVSDVRSHYSVWICLATMTVSP